MEEIWIMLAVLRASFEQWTEPPPIHHPLHTGTDVYYYIAILQTPSGPLLPCQKLGRPYAFLLTGSDWLRRW